MMKMVTMIFIKKTVKGNIEFIDQTNNKTKIISVNGYRLMHRAKKTVIASKGRYKKNKINRISVVS